MKQKGNGVLIGAVLVFLGLVSIPLGYKFAILLDFDPFSTFLTAMVPAVLIGGGLLLIYVTDMLQKPGTVPDDATTIDVPKRIVIDINDKGISLKTGGMSPQEIITFLELSKYYVITKSVRTGSLIDIVKRE